ncbi:MAG: hypothetical protein R3B90_11435 [Planctomycetaceae bacterium]
MLGLPRDWEAVYRPALDRLAPRVRVASVYSSVPRQAREQAAELAAEVASGIRVILDRHPSNGVALLDADWWSPFALARVLQTGRAVYWRVNGQVEPAQLASWHEQSRAAGGLVMPEMRLRYTPATLRLRELLATELGPVRSVDVHPLNTAAPAGRQVDVELYDWCRCVFDATPLDVHSIANAQAGSNAMRTITLRLKRRQEDPFVVVIRRPTQEQARSERHPQATRKLAADEWPYEFCIACKYGEARIEDASHLRWRVGGQEHTESLGNERTAVSVALDHFARRLAGGLIPVPDLSDLLAAHRICDRASQSCETGTTATFSDAKP